MPWLTCIPALCGAVFNPCKEIFVCLNDNHNDVRRLDTRFGNLTVERDFLLSKKCNGEDMVEWNVITEDTKKENYQNLQKSAESLILRFERYKTRYERITGKVNNCPTRNPQDGCNSQGNGPTRNPQDGCNSQGNGPTRNPQDGCNSPGNRPRCVIGSKLFYEVAILSRRIDELTGEMDTLRRKMEAQGMTWNKPERVKKEEGADKIDDIKSLTDTLEDVLSHLKKDGTRTIQIWGWPGVGKTTILKHLNNKMDGTTMFDFDIVIWVNVPEEEETVVENDNREERRLLNIQEEIIERLKLKEGAGDISSSSSRKQTAATISQVLGNKKYLVILDRVYSDINLHEVGIRSTHKDGKVVFASRGRVFMRADHHIAVKKLEKEDALKLFKNILGDLVSPDSTREAIAERMVEHLGGLLKLINGWATHLKYYCSLEHEWQEALTSLQSSIVSRQGIVSPQDDVEEIFKYFKYQWERLCDKKKKCLLYTASYPTSYEIGEDNLVEYWATEKLFPIDSGNSHRFRSAQDTGHSILTNLINICLLDRYRSKLMNYITVPQPFRKWATRISSDQESCAKRVYSLMCSSTEQLSLPCTPECLNATTLLIHQSNVDPIQCPPTLQFVGYNFRVVNFQQTGIISLPPSLFRLSTLKGLYLNNCRHLHKLLPAIGNIENLEVLDIRGTGINSLPNEIRQLQSLRCFKVSFSWYDATAAASSSTTPISERVLIPRHLIENLRNLEKLSIFVDRNEQSWIDQTVADIAGEMGSLRLLSSLCFNFPSQESLATFLRKRKSLENEATLPLHWVPSFRSYKLQVGTDPERSNPYNHELHSTSGSSDDPERRHLIFSAGQGITPETAEVLKEASAFELIGHKGSPSLSDFGMENMTSLELCVIENCNDMTSIVDAAKDTNIVATAAEDNSISVAAAVGDTNIAAAGDTNIAAAAGNTSIAAAATAGDTSIAAAGSRPRRSAFPLLEKLHIKNLQSLNCVVSEGSVEPGTLARLTTLTLYECPRLGKVFSHGIVQELVELRHLKVENCSQVKEIIQIDSGVIQPSATLPKLENLHLVNLEKLISICQSDSLDWPSLIEIEIKECGILENLSLTANNANQLKTMVGRKDWWKPRGGNQNSMSQNADASTSASAGPVSNGHGNENSTGQNASDPTSASPGPVTFSSCLPFLAKPRAGNKISMSRKASASTSESGPVSNGHGNKNRFLQLFRFNQAPPSEGQTPPEEVHAPPEEGQAPPEEVHAPRGEVQAPPEEGQAPPGEGLTPPGEGRTPYEEVQTPSVEVDAPPGEGQKPPDERQAPPNVHGNENSMTENSSASKSSSVGFGSNGHGNEISVSQNASDPTFADVGPVDEPSCFSSLFRARRTAQEASSKRKWHLGFSGCFHDDVHLSKSLLWLLRILRGSRGK